MKILCVVPVGPGHEAVSRECVESLLAARLPDGTERSISVVDDTDGMTGRSAARNIGARAEDSEWLFFLDADDLAYPGCFELLCSAVASDPGIEALWGPIMLRREMIFSDGKRVSSDEIHYGTTTTPISDWGTLVCSGHGSLMVGMFVRRDLFDRVGGWCEEIDISEDYDFCWACAAHARSWRRGESPLVLIRRTNHSAGGRRGVDPTATVAIVNLAGLRHNAIYDYWRARGPVPWTQEERENRPAIYGYFGQRWRNEPYGPESE